MVLIGLPALLVQTGNAIAITLGTASGATSTAAAAGAIVWTPAAAATDVAGNASTTTVGRRRAPPISTSSPFPGSAPSGKIG